MEGEYINLTHVVHYTMRSIHRQSESWTAEGSEYRIVEGVRVTLIVLGLEAPIIRGYATARIIKKGPDANNLSAHEEKVPKNELLKALSEKNLTKAVKLPCSDMTYHYRKLCPESDYC